jgi:SAM-dependent methyltransferase
MTSYNSSDFWYERRQSTTGVTARRVLELVQSVAPFRSVVDIGCGTGAWLSEAKRIGASNVLGFDGAHVPQDKLSVRSDEFQAIDLSTQMPVVDFRFDLSISLEVAEHLPASQGPELVRALCSLSDNVLFSAAIAGQGGNGHINERPQSYWINLFDGLGYGAYDFIRPQIWNDADAPAWYCQNILFLSKRSMTEELSLRGYPVVPTTMSDLVHPRVFAPVVNRSERPGVKKSARLLQQALRARIARLWHV